MYIYSSLRKGITSEINAIGRVITIVSLGLMLASVLMLDNDRKQAAGKDRTIKQGIHSCVETYC